MQRGQHVRTATSATSQLRIDFIAISIFSFVDVRVFSVSRYQYFVPLQQIDARGQAVRQPSRPQVHRPGGRCVLPCRRCAPCARHRSGGRGHPPPRAPVVASSGRRGSKLYAVGHAADAGRTRGRWTARRGSPGRRGTALCRSCCAQRRCRARSSRRRRRSNNCPR